MNPVEWMQERKNRLCDMVGHYWGDDDADVLRHIIESYISSSQQIGALHGSVRELMQRLAKYEQPQQYDQIEQWPRYTGD